MKLPDIERTSVSEDKIVNYLLSFEHRDGHSKANFFTMFGFSRGKWQILANALIQHAKQHEVQKIESSPFGERYVVEGPIHCPDGRSPQIRTVWFVRTREESPHFVTAYPLAGGRGK